VAGGATVMMILFAMILFVVLVKVLFMIADTPLSRNVSLLISFIPSFAAAIYLHLFVMMRWLIKLTKEQGLKDSGSR